jgi:hypothetical protein
VALKPTTLGRRFSCGSRNRILDAPITAEPPASMAARRELTIEVRYQTERLPSLDFRNKMGTLFPICSSHQEASMLRIFVEEAAALASITLFVGMIAVWAQLIPQF